jgi:hypothetical protein
MQSEYGVVKDLLLGFLKAKIVQSKCIIKRQIWKMHDLITFEKKRLAKK